MVRIVLIVIILTIYLINFYRKAKSLPAGAIPFPIVGNLFTFDFNDIHLWVCDHKKIYGSVFTIWIPEPLVVLANYDLINEALVTNGDHYSGRDVNGFPGKLLLEKVNNGVIMSEGEK
uniref:Cytochrome P450 n=1 Tax=Strongyloides papillosus TaxID=174720 RepID=A0A0N5B6X2_STREA